MNARSDAPGKVILSATLTSRSEVAANRTGRVNEV